MEARSIVDLVECVSTSDGAGVRLRRSIGTPHLDHLDPFLLLDEFRSDEASDYIAGFPPHPHRGFETVTYMLEGAMRHRDHTGAEGHLGPGSIQWMTAGRGIVHEEMPEQEQGLLWGFQLWVNLPRAQKMMPPRYQDIPSEQVPEVKLSDTSSVRVLAGEAHGLRGPVEGIVTEPLYLDVRLGPKERLEEPVTRGHTAFAYVYRGSAVVGGAPVPAHHPAVLSDGDAVSLEAGEEGAGLLLVAAQPLREPIARWGPFVMTTPEEIREAILDSRSGRLTA